MIPMKARIVHSHPLTNLGKLRDLGALQEVYRSDVQRYVDEMLAAHRYHLKPKEWRAFFSPSILSSQLKKNVAAQAVHLVESWVKSLYLRLKPRIFEQPFTDQQRMELRCIGKYLLTKTGKFGKGTISQEMIDLYWSWVWNPEISGEPPKVSEDFPMWLSEMCVSFASPKKATGLEGWWVAVSCLRNGKRLQIPLASSPYLTDPTVFANSVLIQKRQNKWCFQFTDKTPDPEFEPTEKKLGVDVGLNVLAATSDGKLLGQTCKPKFDRLYRKVQNVRKNRMRQGLPKNSPRLQRMEQHLSGLVKTETGTVANKLVKAYPDTTFVIENLDLKGCRGQKRFAYKALHRALSHKAPVLGVNPAYTSQTCPSCGYVSKRNRNGVVFKCGSCGRKSHADVVGGINLLGRSEDKRIGSTDYYRNVGTILRERYRRSRDSSSRRKGEKPRRVLTVAPEAYCEGTCSHSFKDGQDSPVTANGRSTVGRTL